MFKYLGGADISAAQIDLLFAAYAVAFLVVAIAIVLLARGSGMFHVKHARPALVVLALAAAAAFGLSACTTAQTDAFVASIGNFNRGVAAVDASIAQVSATLYSNCTSLQAVGQAAVDITGTCTKASPVVNAVNDVITGYCSTAPASGIASAIATTASTINSTKTQLSAAKSACAAGG